MKKKLQQIRLSKGHGERAPLVKGSWRKDFHDNWAVYALFLPVAVLLIIFSYIPMFGILMAFEDYSPVKGVFGSTWVWFDNFKELMNSREFGLVMRNTACMAALNLTVGFLAPVILALLISQQRSRRYGRVVQTVTYMPYFVSTVVVCSLASEFLSSTGALTMFLNLFGFEKQNWLANPNIPAFWLINTFLEIWQGAGYGSIIYIAAIYNVNPNLMEAAAMDGAGRWRRLWHITIPSILPTIITMFVLRVGMVFKTGFDKVLLLYMPKTYDVADVLTSYTYRLVMTGSNYGLSTASGLFQSVIATALLIISNKLSQKVSKSSLF